MATNGKIPQKLLADDSVGLLELKTAVAGDGIQGGGGSALALDLKASSGLKIDTGEVAVEPTDFAGTGLEDDGSDNLRLASQGTGIAGGAGSTLSVDTSSTVTFSGATWTFGADELLVSTPTQSTAVPNKAYVDSVASGLDTKDSVRVATAEILDDDADITGTPVYVPTDGTSARGQITATLAVSGVLAIDGVTIADSDRILVKDEDSGAAEVHSVDTVADVGQSLMNDYFIMYETPASAFYVWMNVAALGSDPVPGPPVGVTYVGVECTVAEGASADAVATAIKTALDASAYLGSTARTTNALTMTNTHGGDVTDVADGGGLLTGFTFGTDTPGTGMGPAANGIYDVGIVGTALTLDRATDFDADAEVTAGAFTFVEEGTAAADSGWVVTSDNPLTIGGVSGSPILWSQFSGAGAITAGDGLTKSGATINAVGGDGITANANDLAVDLKTSGGLKIDTAQIAVEPTDFAGTGLEDDGSDNLRIAAAAAGNGLTGGAGSALAVGAGNGIAVSANDVAVEADTVLTADAAALAIGANGVSIDGDLISIDETLTNITPDTGGLGADVKDLAAIILGIDNELGSVGGTPRQELMTTEVITGSDTAMADQLTNTPVSSASVKLHYFGILLQQGAGKDYTVAGKIITWLASTGTVPDQATSEELIASYDSSD